MRYGVLRAEPLVHTAVIESRIADIGRAVGQQTVGRFLRSPLTIHVGFLVVTEVVDVGESEEHLFARRLHTEAFQRKAAVGAHSCLDVAKEGGVVFLLQLEF